MECFLQVIYKENSMGGFQDDHLLIGDCYSEVIISTLLTVSELSLRYMDTPECFLKGDILFASQNGQILHDRSLV